MKMGKYVLGLAIQLLILSPFVAYADCVIGAKSKTSYVVLDSHTIMLQGGYGEDIIIKTFSFITDYSSVTVLKDDFCSFESAVLYIDGEVVDAEGVTGVR